MFQVNDVAEWKLNHPSHPPQSSFREMDLRTEGKPGIQNPGLFQGLVCCVLSYPIPGLFIYLPGFRASLLLRGCKRKPSVPFWRCLNSSTCKIWQKPLSLILLSVSFLSVPQLSMHKELCNCIPPCPSTVLAAFLTSQRKIRKLPLKILSRQSSGHYHPPSSPYLQGEHLRSIFSVPGILWVLHVHFILIAAL